MISMKEAAFEMKAALLAGDLFTFGDMLNRSWRSKKSTAATISNDRVEGLLQVGLAAGAYACKVSGAGGGGFLMFMTEPESKTGCDARAERRGWRGDAGATDWRGRGGLDATLRRGMNRSAAATSPSTIRQARRS